MDIRGIRYFVQIAELGSITRAANHLRIAQPALTRHVQLIEQELGADLLVRLPRGVRLTGAGRQFLDHCHRILREVDRARDGLRSSSAAAGGKVILGLTPTLGPLLLPGVVARARRQCPQISLKIVEWFSTQLYDTVLTGRVDVAVLTNAPVSRGIKLTPLISEPIAVLTPPQARAGRRYYTLPELAKTPVVTTEAIRAIVEEQIGRYGWRLNVEAEVDAVEAIRRLLLNGQGVSVLPVSAFFEDIRAGRICAFQIADTNVHRLLTIAHPAERTPRPAVEEISQIVTSEVNAMRDAGAFNIPAHEVGDAAPTKAAQPAKKLRERKKRTAA